MNTIRKIRKFSAPLSLEREPARVGQIKNESSNFK